MGLQVCSAGAFSHNITGSPNPKPRTWHTPSAVNWVVWSQSSWSKGSSTEMMG